MKRTFWKTNMPLAPDSSRIPEGEIRYVYIDVEMPWEDYKHLLGSMAQVGIVEKGYYEASVAKGQSFLRKPGLKK